MPTVQAFCGWRYDPDKVSYADVVTPPYDVIDDAMQDKLYENHPRNCVRLIYGKQNESDNDQDNRYTRAAGHLDAWREEGLFVQDQPSIYLYKQTFESEGESLTRTGFFARVLLGDWGEQGVYPHERTLAGPKVDRLNLMRAVRGQTGPVFGLISDLDGTMTKHLSGIDGGAPLASISEDSGVVNNLWVVNDPAAINAIQDAALSQNIYIADGHHRYETALAYRNEVREKIRASGQQPPALGELDSDYILMAIVPDSDPGLVIWPTHRLVHGVSDFDPDTLLTGCREFFDVTAVDDAQALQPILDKAKKPTFGLILGDRSYALTLRDDTAMETRAPDAPEAWRELDVSVLHLLILEDLLGIDEEKLLRKENIIYSKKAEEAITMSQEGREGIQAGFLMRPTEMAQVRAVAGAGHVMPQKSTFFYPKILTGLVFHLFW